LPGVIGSTAAHSSAGKLVGRRKGHGKVRTHLVFTIEDFKQFWERLAEPAATPTVVHLPSPQKHPNMALGGVMSEVRPSVR
jgi:hypothetical protein